MRMMRNGYVQTADIAQKEEVDPYMEEQPILKNQQTTI